nr:DEAD/DEAH box helicase family protein [Alphaproteobacteria bacterium]
MELKTYQIQVLETLEKYLKILEAEYKEKHDYYQYQIDKGNVDAIHPEYSDYLSLAWESAKAQFPIERDSRDYTARKDGLDRKIPNICFKIPTGGGKTLLATCALERIQKDYLKKNNGFVLWIVPSEVIYRQTSKQLYNREHPYRQMLDRVSGGRTKILQKNDKFVKQDIEDNLCVMLLMLQSSNRENKDTLRMFRDSGKFTSFFPEADDYIGNNTLLNQVKNLDIADLADDVPNVISGLNIKQSLGNVMKLVRPIIIIDEGHKAVSEKALETINNFHPRFILELSATPKPRSNILVDIKGMALKQEEMIKLPIHVSSHTQEDWKQTLNHAHNKLNQLHDDAERLQHENDRYIRPIMVIKAEPKSKNSTYDHVEDIKQYLIEHLNIPATQIRIKLSEKDEIKNEDLLHKLCPVRYIITKEALKEGWDCPFAYILAILT